MKEFHQTQFSPPFSISIFDVILQKCDNSSDEDLQYNLMFHIQGILIPDFVLGSGMSTIDLALESLRVVQDSPCFIPVILLLETDAEKKLPTPLTLYNYNSFLKYGGLQRKGSVFKIICHLICFHLNQEACTCHRVSISSGILVNKSLSQIHFFFRQREKHRREKH